VNRDLKIDASVLLRYNNTSSSLVKGMRKTTKKTLSQYFLKQSSAHQSQNCALLSSVWTRLQWGYVIVWRNRLPSREQCLLRVEDGATPRGYIHVVNMPPAGGKLSSYFKIFQRLCTTSQLVQRMSQ